MSGEEINKKSLNIIKTLQSHVLYQNSQKTLFYYPIKNEVDLLPLLQKNDGKTKLLPKIRNNCLSIHKISNEKDLVDGVYNTKEPHELCEMVEEQEIDLILVPGIVFDKKGNRLGYGKGYYDRLLKTLSCPKIGLAFEQQISDYIPTEPHDQKMDLIITEKNIYTI